MRSLCSMEKVLSIAVIGAGVAGSRCAQVLSGAGHAVRVWDKARGPGGRLATRLARWTEADGRPRVTAFDHGAAGFSAHTPAFAQHFVSAGAQAGWLLPWLPAPEDAAEWAPASPQPEVCRHLLHGSSLHAGVAVQALHREGNAWRLELAGEPAAHGVPAEHLMADAVLLALPPAQSEPLLAPHHSAWARQAALVGMNPCWTLMAVSNPPDGHLPWALSRPRQGPLAQVLRQQERPGREAPPDEAHWVAHASAAWSREHLERDPAWIQAQLQDALAAHLGEALTWRYATAHRWRYAQCAAPALHPLQLEGRAWWCGQRHLGACGDWQGGGGVEGAWLSGDALAQALLKSEPLPAAPPDSPFVPHTDRAAGVCS